MLPTGLRGLSLEACFTLVAVLIAYSATAQGSQTDAAPPAAPVQSQPSAALPGDSTKIEIIKSEKAEYPLEALQTKMQGEVMLRLHVSETGDVEEIEVLSGDPIFAKSAVAAAKRWKFKPFIRNGKPIKVGFKMPFDFAFKENVQTGPDNLSKSPAPGYANTAIRSTGGAQADNQAPQRVRVSAGVTQGLLIRKVSPVYPEEARRARIQGTVILQAAIDKDGRIKDLKYISGPRELADSAIGAVQQWRYRPYLLMGEPVEVETTIQVNYQLRW